LDKESIVVAYTQCSVAYNSGRDTLWFSDSRNIHTSVVGPQVSRLSLPDNAFY